MLLNDSHGTHIVLDVIDCWDVSFILTTPDALIFLTQFIVEPLSIKTVASMAE